MHEILDTPRGERVKRSLASTLKVLEAQLAALDRDVGSAASGSLTWRTAEDLPTSILGIGDVTARKLNAGLAELDRLGRHRIAALVGIARIDIYGGLCRGRRVIAGGRGAMRSALFMATLKTIHRNAAIRDHDSSLVAPGRAKQLAIVA